MEKTSVPREESFQQPPSSLAKISYAILLGSFILLPLFFIPSTYVGFLYGKIGLLTFTALVPLILLLVEAIYKGEFSIPSPLFLLTLISVPLFVTVSALMSLDPSAGLIGSGSEFDTAYFVALCFLLLILIVVYFQEKQKIFLAYVAFLAVFSLLAIFHLLRFFFGVNFLSFGVFNSVVSNTVGSWSDLGIYAGIAVIVSFLTIEFLNLGRLAKSILYIVLALGLILTSVANFYVVYDFMGVSVTLSEFIGFISLVSFLYVASLNYVGKRKPVAGTVAEDELVPSPRKASKFKIPVSSLVVLMFMLISSIWATPITSAFYAYTKVSPAEISDVRPTIAGTMQVVSSMMKTGIRPTLIGVGPSRFFAEWSSFKPQGVNETDLWNTDFSYGAGYVLTFLVTSGLLGFLAWLFFIGCLFYFSIRSIFSGLKDKFSLYLIISSSSVAFYLWFINFFYVTNVTLIILTFIFSGLCVASLVREGVIKITKVSWFGSHRKGFISLLIIVLLIIASVVIASVWTNHFIASIYAARAIDAVNVKNDTSAAEGFLISAINKDPSDTNLKLFSQLKLYEFQNSLNANPPSSTTAISTTTSMMYGDALTAALQAARVADPYNYQNWIFLGNVYQLGAAAGIDFGQNHPGDLALYSYTIATKLAPSSPLPFFLLGRLYALAHNFDLASANLQTALSLKSNYTDAQNVLSQLPTAGQVSNAKAAAGTSTSNASSSPSATSSKNIPPKASSHTSTSTKTSK